ncbi:tRNA modification GTPase trmE [Thalassoporum mexicanum PCC 7367]|uniref:tRNA uridine-5-carboxymethylaminomethyl(34) synthesis GTPase MnmE n=1 Tax=Thalassoporum mexicanum TaxID=3457544 RepID=UPI00029F9E19|nr:tRNA uridine-5-carboxymethylaminomethyl(34) synthesis GTPase MnmE [Pseudanabaena sp. PCC 7367]AFY69567.1 tRNA modification GTPase trmE [Pseudanabaena sp. PCC 7367]
MISDTIAAIATAIVPQQGSVGIVRMSGEQALAIAKCIFSAPGNQTWQSHRILYGYAKSPDTGETIDECLLLIMQAPRSYTREDVIELHCHGGAIAVQQILNLCLEQGARLAQPGEFTLRAFLNGRIDLTQAEGINNLVGSTSPQAAQAAIASLRGKLAQPLKDLRARCLDILAEVEARIDFEDDLPPLDQAWVAQQLALIAQQAQQILDTADRGELLHSGLKVAIVGRPNVGKSSLLNMWSRSDRAIVTDLPGTTRDVVDSHLVVGGIPIKVLDTAGIRQTEDMVEQIGVERSQQAAQEADLVLLVIDAAQGWTEADEQIYQIVGDRPIILIINKVDLLDDQATQTNLTNLTQSALSNRSEQLAQLSDYQSSSDLPQLDDRKRFMATVKTAAALNQGIEQLEAAILASVNASAIQAGDLDVAINQRQKECLLRAVQGLAKVQEAIAAQLPLDFWTIDLRATIMAIGEITGESVTESVLDQIFSRFCIGK